MKEIDRKILSENFAGGKTERKHVHEAVKVCKSTLNYMKFLENLSEWSLSAYFFPLFWVLMKVVSETMMQNGRFGTNSPLR